MAFNSVVIDRTVGQVFALLSDGWSYTNWVVGTSHTRAVTSDWPEPGAKLHHAAGSWPLLRRDETVVEQVVAAQRLVLMARARPFGQARIVLELAVHGDDGCRLTMTETPVTGPGRWVHNPLTDALLARRNSESLARLKALAERPISPTET